MKTKTLWIRDEFLEPILAGKKTLEIRVAYSNITRLEPGDRVLFNERYPFKIHRIARYENFEKLLANESAEAIRPGLPPDQLLGALRAVYPADKEALGVVALEIEPVAD